MKTWSSQVTVGHSVDPALQDELDSCTSKHDGELKGA